MPQHFLLSKEAKTLTLASVARMSDEEAEAIFRKIRWASNGGNPFCPKCGCTIVYDCRRRERHSALAVQSLPAQLLDHERHAVSLAQDAATGLPHGDCDLRNEVKGKSMLAMSRDLGDAYKTAFVLAHKMREAMATEVRTQPIGGEGKRAEIDGGYFGGYVKPANRREDRRDRRLRRQPVRQAPGRGRDPRARRQDAAGRVPQRG